MIAYAIRMTWEVLFMEEALEAIKKGQMVILTDHRDRENEGDLICPAQDITGEKINFMVQKARGLVCVALHPFYVDRLQLPLMGELAGGDTSGQGGAAFTLSLDGVDTGSGISPKDRARTIQQLIDPRARREDFVIPGHMFPLKGAWGGLGSRMGHTEGSLELMALAGKMEAAVLCELIAENGEMARDQDLKDFSSKYAIPVISIADLVSYCKKTKGYLSCQKNTAPRPGSMGSNFYTSAK
jgi:3,4-dihydroxy-2-butanone 4-phosphate synthase